MRRLLALVSVIVLVDVMFYSAITPLLPSYVDDLDLTKSEAGVLSGAYAAGTMGASLPAGWLALRWGVRPTLLSGLVLLAVACVGFGMASSFELLTAARLLQGIGGAGSWAAGLAWLIAVAPRERRGQVIGTALGTAIAGAIGGPVLGAAAEGLGTELVFSAVGLVALVLALLVAVMPRAEAQPARGGVLRAVRDRRVLAGAWLTMLPALVFGTISVLAPLRLDELGATTVGVAAVFLVAAAVEAVMSPVVGRASDRLGRLAPLRTGLVGVLVVCLLLPAPGHAWLVGGLVVVGALFAGMLWAPAMALLSDGAEAAGVAQAIGFALVNLAWGGGQVGGAAGGGALADATADVVAFLVLAALSALTLPFALGRRGVRLTAAPTGSASPGSPGRPEPGRR
jgi:MFS family permease